MDKIDLYANGKILRIKMMDIKYSTLYLIDSDAEVKIGWNALKIIKERFITTFKFPEKNKLHDYRDDVKGFMIVGLGGPYSIIVGSLNENGDLMLHFYYEYIYHKVMKLGKEDVSNWIEIFESLEV
ncbi:MAG: hypothetical protein FWC47_15135 [Oscillospiraceae bacterium]|nr:hypothetical protein [Oscillospiraceae bacterium]